VNAFIIAEIQKKKLKQYFKKLLIKPILKQSMHLVMQLVKQVQLTRTRRQLGKINF
jgi:F0F1-type ATP synthase membrane subunit a